jgi:hypothetical protein
MLLAGPSLPRPLPFSDLCRGQVERHRDDSDLYGPVYDEPAGMADELNRIQTKLEEPDASQ